MYTYEWPRPALTTDIVVFRYDEKAEDPGHRLQLLLIKRKNEPFKDYWALPGGYVEEGESLVQGALRELKEETGITNLELTQVAAFGDPGRDPRGWQVTVGFYGVTDSAWAEAGDDAKDATWFPVGPIISNGYLDLACDHREIIQAAFDKMINSRWHHEA